MVSWRRQHKIFLLLLLAILIAIGFLVTYYDQRFDVSERQRNSLSQQSIDVVSQLNAPLEVTAFVRGNPQTQQLVRQIIARYQAYADVNLVFESPDAKPDWVSQFDISRDGELVFSYQGELAHAPDLSEQSITRAIYQLVASRAYSVFFVTGQGERGFDQDAAKDYAQLVEQLSSETLSFGQIDLQGLTQLPDNVDLLVIADPKIAYKENAIARLMAYLESGGQLLWLAEPDSVNIADLSAQLGVRSQAQTILSGSGKKYGFSHPSYLAIEPSDEMQSGIPILASIDTYLLFPSAAPIANDPHETAQGNEGKNDWQITSFLFPAPTADAPMLQSADNTITQASNPVIIGIEATRQVQGEKQSVVLIGDSDFMSNRFLGVGQNREFAELLIRRLLAPDASGIQIGRTMPEPVVLDENTRSWLVLWLVVIMPLFIFLAGYSLKRWLR